MPNSPHPVAGLLVLIPVTIAVGISTVFAEAVAQGPMNKSQEIVLSTLSINIDNGTITRINNNSQTVIGFDELRQALNKETEGRNENATGIVINNATGLIRIENNLNSTNSAVVEEARNVSEEARKVGVSGEVHETAIYCGWTYVGFLPFTTQVLLCFEY